MARFALRTLKTAFASSIDTTQPVHFHNGPQGQPAACFDPGCRSPRLDAG
jgi:hypothetical protein